MPGVPYVHSNMKNDIFTDSESNLSSFEKQRSKVIYFRHRNLAKYQFFESIVMNYVNPAGIVLIVTFVGKVHCYTPWVIVERNICGKVGS
jgi:hypothetical protein